MQNLVGLDVLGCYSLYETLELVKSLSLSKSISLRALDSMSLQRASTCMELRTFSILGSMWSSKLDELETFSQLASHLGPTRQRDLTR